MKTKQNQPASSQAPKKRGRPAKNTLTPVNKKPRKAGIAKVYKEKLEAENKQLYDFCLQWRDKCDKQDKEIARIQHLYMDSQAVVRYLESKIVQLLGDE